SHIAEARLGPIHFKRKSVGKTVAHVGASTRQAVAPGGKVNPLLFSELHIDAALADSLAAHARKIGLTADLEREAAVQDMIPHIPFGNPWRVHRADEIAR